MAGLWAFTTSALRNGSTRVHSIGELTYRGDPEADAPWHWYEAAVNQVFAGTPLHATCLVDTTRTPDHVLDEVRRVHPACSHAGALRPSEHFDEGSWAAPQLAEVAVPDTPPALRARVTDRTELRELRERIEAAAGLLGPALVCRLLLVTTELATNALLHGGGEPEVAVWVEPSAAVVRVSDGGPGLTDPFASLRPPELPLRGAGLWVAHVESDQLHLASSPGSTTVTARFDR
jgi:anti-sigma regulatory factor (Ser/Thr protein kinase)